MGGGADAAMTGASSLCGRYTLLIAWVPSTCVFGESELSATVTPIATAAINTTKSIDLRNRSSAARIFFWRVERRILLGDSSTPATGAE